MSLTGAFTTILLNVTYGLSANLSTAGYDIKFGDSTSGIAFRNRARFGDGEDMTIFHSGTHSYIQHSGTGNLYIDGSTDDLVLQAGDDVRILTQGNENAINPDFVVHNSQLFLSWTQTKSSASQIRISLFNDNFTNPNWQIVDRYDDFGSSRFGLNYDTAKDASNSVMASTGSKLFTLWAEFDNKSNSQLRVVENQM